MTPRKTAAFLIVALGALVLAPVLGIAPVQARAAHTKHHAHAVQKKSVHSKPARAARKLAAKAPAQSLAIVTKPANDAPDFDFSSRIEDAQELAAKQPVLPGDIQVDGGGNLSRFTWVLVVGQKSGPLTVIRMDEAGRNDQGFTITWPINNYLNTKFKVALPEGMIVFAQRRPVRARNSWEEAVYTAYAPELDTKKMREAGMDFLQQLEHQAYNHLQSHDVRSRAVPNETVADQIPRSMVLRLMITEHVDPLHMKYVGIEQCVHEVLITLAANRSRAYAYARSSAGALGLPQFMEQSYQMVRANYPNALLEPDFTRGMTNLRNAVMASVLHMDLELAHLPERYLKPITGSGQHLAAFLAAGYNRNPAHVARTYDRTRSFTGGNVSFENKMYVRIQSWVGSYLKKEYDIS